MPCVGAIVPVLLEEEEEEEEFIRIQWILGQNRVGEEHLTEGGFKTEELKWQKTLHTDEKEVHLRVASYHTRHSIFSAFCVEVLPHVILYAFPCDQHSPPPAWTRQTARRERLATPHSRDCIGENPRAVSAHYERPRESLEHTLLRHFGASELIPRKVRRTLFACLCSRLWRSGRCLWQAFTE